MKPSILILTNEQTHTVLNQTWGRTQVRDRQVLVLLLHTGIKIGELVKLNVGDVYTGNRVRRSLWISPRPDKSGRAIPLDRASREAIALVLEFNRSRGFLLQPNEPLVVSRQRNRLDSKYRITARQIQRIVKALGDDAAVGVKLTPTTFRHNYAKMMLDEGADMEKLQQLLGHRALKTTREYYATTDETGGGLPVLDEHSVADVLAGD